MRRTTHTTSGCTAAGAAVGAVKHRPALGQRADDLSDVAAVVDPRVVPTIQAETEATQHPRHPARLLGAGRQPALRIDPLDVDPLPEVLRHAVISLESELRWQHRLEVPVTAAHADHGPTSPSVHSDPMPAQPLRVSLQRLAKERSLIHARLLDACELRTKLSEAWAVDGADV